VPYASRGRHTDCRIASSREGHANAAATATDPLGLEDRTMESTHTSHIADEINGELHFTLQLHTGMVTGVLSEAVWESRYGRLQSDSTLREIFMANRALLEAALLRRQQMRRQSRVVLRALDL
jgi:hypothetical protein